MATAYTPILKLALPVTGELNGTWGDVVNQNITEMVEQAVAGLATINTWTANSHTLTTANGTTSESRCAMLVIDDDGAGNPSAAATVICPTATKSYIVRNLCGQTVTVKTAAGTGVAVPNNQAALVFCDGTNVVTGAFNGDVVGPATATNNAIVTFDGTTGKLIKDNSGATISAGVITATGLSGPLNGSVGATNPSTVVATQVDITAQGDLRLQDTTGGQFVALQAPGTIATSYTLTLPVDDGTAGQALITDGSGVLSWSSAASGDVYGPASATDNAVARYDGTTGKIIQNSAVTIADDGATVIAANSTSDGLRITQIGTGNALLVEDAANPDASPFVIDQSGIIGIGTTTPQSTFSIVSGIGIQSSSAFAPQVVQRNKTNDTSAPYFISQKDRAGAIVQSGDAIGNLVFQAYDGASYINSAIISAAVDGTPGTNDMPGRLVFSTTADGASSPTERMRINALGNTLFGRTYSGSERIGIGGATSTISSSTSAAGIYNDTTVSSAQTANYDSNSSYIATQAAAFTLTNLRHYRAGQATIGAGSAVTNQYGYWADNSLVGATNNYGFYSNIASGTGRWNFYAAGSAENFFGGATTISANSTTVALRITQVGTGNALLVEDSANPDATPFVITNSGNAIVGTTAIRSVGNSFQTATSAQVFNELGSLDLVGFTTVLNRNDSNGVRFVLGKSRGTAAGGVTAVQNGDNLGQIIFAGADGTTINPIAANIQADVDGTPGTNDMPGRLVFSTTADGASSPTERMRIDNQGRVGVGTAPFAGAKIHAGGIYPSETALSLPVLADGVIPSASTALVQMFRSSPSTQAASFTLNTLAHFQAVQGTLGAGSAINSQFGFVADNTITGATNNFGFYSNIASGTGRWNFYAAGTAANVFAGTTSIGGAPGAESLRVTPVASAVNYLTVSGSATGFTPNIQAQGSDTNIAISITSKGGSPLDFFTSAFGAQQFRIAHTASAVNYLQVTGGATGNAATLSAQGSDTNIDLALTPKGTGRVRFGTLTANADAPITGYIEVKDSAGNVRKLAVIA